jgi:hypothetical protein
VPRPFTSNNNEQLDTPPKQEGQAQRSRKKRNTIRVYPKMWAPIAGKVGANTQEGKLESKHERWTMGLIENAIYVEKMRLA